MRTFRLFKYKDASYRISVSGAEKEITAGEESNRLFRLVADNIKAVRTDIEKYIERQSAFLSSLEPLPLLPGAPEAVKRMSGAAEKTGLGPMAAVAGTIAQCAAELSAQQVLSSGYNEIIIENGGDIYISLNPPKKDHPPDGQVNPYSPVVTGIFSGLDSVFSSLALKILPEDLPLAVCSSSGRMGHSLSLGDCDLSTVISKDASLADAAATLGGNLVKTEEDLGSSAERIGAIDGVIGVILIKNDRIAMAGKLPQLIKHHDAAGLDKITITGKEF